MLKVGQKAPDFSLPNQDDAIINLKDLRGRKVLVWFFTCLLYTSDAADE